jgi:hypothetical protein
MRRLASLASCVLLGACAIGGPPVRELPPPELVIDVANATAEEVSIGWEFESEGMSGSGETLAAPCRRQSMPVSSIGGDYRISVDGTPVFEGAVPERAGSGTFLVVRVIIGPEGEAEVDAPGVAPDPPRDVSMALPGCADS